MSAILERIQYILGGGDEVSMHKVKKVVNQADRVSKLEKCTTSGYTAYRCTLKDAGTPWSWIKAMSSV